MTVPLSVLTVLVFLAGVLAAVAPATASTCPPGVTESSVPVAGKFVAPGTTTVTSLDHLVFTIDDGGAALSFVLTANSCCSLWCPAGFTVAEFGNDLPAIARQDLRTFSDRSPENMFGDGPMRPPRLFIEVSAHA